MRQRTYFIASNWNNRPVSQHFQALARELAARGHRVVLIVPGNALGAGSPSTNPAILNWPSARPRHWKDAIFLFRLMRQYRPDCLIANFGAANVMTLVGYLTRVKVRVNWYHTLTTQTLIDNPVSVWKRYFLTRRKAFVYRLATHLVPVSHAASEDVQRVFNVPEHKCHVFHNSMADPLNGDTLPQASEDRLICFGRMFPSKGQDVVIKALAILREAVPGARVEFVGNGPSRDSFLQLARDCEVADRCTFEDSVVHDEVLARMASAVATLVPSRSDNCPLVTIESLAVGTPVIACGVGGIVEIVRDKVDGFLVSPDDPQALAERIKVLLTNPEVRKKMSANARERFLTKFERHNIIKEQIQWFETIVASQNRHSAELT